SSIAISSDSSEESVGTSIARIILFGTIPTAILATVHVVDPPVVSTLPYTFLFLYTDSSENDTSKRPPSQDPYEVTVARSSIAISSDSSEESVRTSIARIILFGTIPTAILATVHVVDPPVISTLPYTFLFLYTDSSDNDTSKRPPSQDPYEVTVARWKSRVIARSSPPSSPTDMTLPICQILPAPPSLPRRPAVLVLPRQPIHIGRP
nr:hypothetical protein [Tanacetum cinerariifolium]